MSAAVRNVFETDRGDLVNLAFYPWAIVILQQKFYLKFKVVLYISVYFRNSHISRAQY